LGGYISNLERVGLFGVGIGLCLGGFVWGGCLLDRKRDRLGLAVALLVPLGGLLAAFAVASGLIG
jgi:hypothetical protein